MKINSKITVIALMTTNIVLILAHLYSHYFDFENQTDFSVSLTKLLSMDVEFSIPTYFAVILLSIISILALKLWRKSKTLGWLGISIVFLYLALDELLSIHEGLIEPMQNLFGITSGPLFFAWIIPVIAIIAVLGMIFAKFFFRLEPQTRNLLFIAAFIFVLGAVGMEMVSGAYWEAHDFQYDMNYRIMNALEEGLENTGSILAIYALAIKLRSYKVKKLRS